MLVHFVGNFGVPWSTECHVAQALEYNGHTVVRLQENDPDVWVGLSGNGADWLEADFFLWVRTGWDWGRMGGTIEHREAEWRFLHRAKKAGIPVVGYHLDRWVGLERQTQIYVEPFFQVDLLCTADGGHDEVWYNAAVAHSWFPPGVSLAECEPGMYRSDLASPLAFVGSHQGSYHQESEHRHELVAWLKSNFTRDCAFWPRPGEPAIRGKDLRDLYQSVEVLVGDSCFSGSDSIRYLSDRTPESLGRGGYLLHPRTEGVTDGQTWGLGNWPTWQEGEHLGCWDAWDWDALGAAIEWALTNPKEREVISQAGRQHTMKHHSYERRMHQLIETLKERGLLNVDA